jgi:hypothetical protein
MSASSWFLTNGTWRLGPLTLDEAIEVLRRPYGENEVMAWREGLADWARPATIPELAEALRAPVPGPVLATGPAWQPAPVPAASGPETPFFLVGGGKLVVMSVVTLGLYELYWFYQHWRRVRDVGGEEIWPFIRMFFTVVFCYPLFRRIADAAIARNQPYVPSAFGCTVVFVVFTILWRLPDPWWLISMFAVFPLVPIQRAASAVALAEVPGADPNTTLTPLNWFGVVLGGLLLILAVIGMAVGEPPATGGSASGDGRRPAPAADVRPASPSGA